MPEPESAPEPAVVPATAPAPPPAPEPEPETEEASPPAPAPNRPALAEGQTPMPEPIPWWEYRTVASGVDYQEDKIALKNGATSGYLRGVYPLALNGRWAIYAAMFAEQVQNRWCCLSYVFHTMHMLLRALHTGCCILDS